MRRPRRPARDLRTAIDCMPPDTRRAMLDALDANPIIVGAYTDRDGGVCPMLAAHRNGGRTSFASFAEAWDRYTRAGGAPRPATEREVRTLKTMLAASIADEDVRGAGALSAAIAEHRATKARRERRDSEAPQALGKSHRDTGERDRSPELRGHHGWAWLRPFRRLDDYERAVEELHASTAAEQADARRERELV